MQQEDEGPEEAIASNDFRKANVLLGRRSEPASIAVLYSPLDDNGSPV